MSEIVTTETPPVVNFMHQPTDKLAAALAKAQAKITNPPKNRVVTVRTKAGGTYDFSYSTLDCIIDHIRGPLTDNGLWFTQILGQENGRYHLITRLLHSSGQSIESRTPILTNSSDNQEFGSALSYMRRYSLTALLGLAADEDDDANKADGNVVTKKADKPKPAPKPNPPKPAPKQKALKQQPDEYYKIMERDLPLIEKVKCAEDVPSMATIILDYNSHAGDSKRDMLRALNDRIKELTKEVACANDATSWRNMIRDHNGHVGNSKTELKKALNNRIKELGVTYEKDTDTFHDPPEGESNEASN